MKKCLFSLVLFGGSLLLQAAPFAQPESIVAPNEMAVLDEVAPTWIGHAPFELDFTNERVPAANGEQPRSKAAGSRESVGAKGLRRRSIVSLNSTSTGNGHSQFAR